MRADLSRRTRHFDTVVHSVVPQKWQRSPSKRYVDTASETSSSSDVFPIAPANLPPNMKADQDDKADKAMVQKLSKKVEDLEHKLSLLTVGMLRDRAKTSEDICGSRTRAESEAIEDASPVAPVCTTKSDL